MNIAKIYSIAAANRLDIAFNAILLPLLVVESASNVGVGLVVVGGGSALGFVSSIVVSGSASTIQLYRTLILWPVLRLASLFVVAIIVVLDYNSIVALAGAAFVIALSGSQMNGVVQFIVKTDQDKERRRRMVSNIQSIGWLCNVLAPLGCGASVGLSPKLSIGLACGLSLTSTLISAKFPRSSWISPGVVDSSRVVEGRSTIWRRLFGGLSVIVRDPVLLILFANSCAFAAVVSGMAPSAQTFMLDYLQYSPIQFGIQMSVPAIAGIAGALISRWVLLAKRPGTVISVCSMLRSLGFFLYATVSPSDYSFYILLGSYSLILFCSSLVNAYSAIIRLNVCDTNDITKVSIAWSSSSSLLSPVGLVLAAPLLASEGPRLVFIMCGLVLSGCSVVLFYVRKRIIDL